MKVLFINMSLNGHHLDYIQSLSEIQDIDAVIISPKASERITARQIVPSNCVFGSMKINDHLKWVRRIKLIAREERPDYIHFTWGDSFYRFFGIGFISICRKYKCGMTFHQFRKDKVHFISIKCYDHLFDDIIVHTSELVTYLTDRKLNNVRHIEYPNFRNDISMDVIRAKEELGIHTSAKVLLCLGGTRMDKGLDILLEALRNVKEPFFLLIAGAEQDIKRELIYKLIEPYKEKVKVILRFLSEQELMRCLAAADLIVLPYRKAFEGASGPLAEGVGCGKCIIGPDHGSLGEIIQNNHLGYTFKTEDVDSLSEVLRIALNNTFQYDSTASDYRNSITVSSFQEAHLKLYKKTLRRK